MNFLSIEYFAAVASEHSFSKAAKWLGITQQTLSANIAALERELGCTLFVRHVPLELTYAGTVFARYAQRFRRDRDALGQEMRDIAGDQAGVLRVGVAYTRSRAIMPPIVKAMQRDCPNIIVELIEGRNDQIQQWLANGDLDLAVADFAGNRPASNLWISITSAWCWSSHNHCGWIWPLPVARRMAKSMPSEPRRTSAPLPQVTFPHWSIARFS